MSYFCSAISWLRWLQQNNRSHEDFDKNTSSVLTSPPMSLEDYCLLYLSHMSVEQPLSRVYTSSFCMCFPHCVAISYYLPWLMKTKVSNRKWQRNAENVFGYRMCKLSFTLKIFADILLCVKFRNFLISINLHFCPPLHFWRFFGEKCLMQKGELQDIGYKLKIVAKFLCTFLGKMLGLFKYLYTLKQIDWSGWWNWP